MDYMVFIGRRLKGLRKSLALTQEEFAEKAGFNYKFYQNLESGRNKYIRLDTIERLSSFLEMEVWEFLRPPSEKFLSECSARKCGKPGRPRKNQNDA